MVLVGTPDGAATSPMRTTQVYEPDLDLPARGNVHHGPVRITLVHVENCPNLPVARQRLADALGSLDMAAVVDERLVLTRREAEAAGFRGSPTILIDGQDLFPAAAEPQGLSCRLYPTDQGPQGAPTVDGLIEALRR